MKESKFNTVNGDPVAFFGHVRQWASEIDMAPYLDGIGNTWADNDAAADDAAEYYTSDDGGFEVFDDDGNLVDISEDDRAEWRDALKNELIKELEKIQ